MRFNNEDYLRAFPREERAAASAPAPATKKNVKDEPGDVLETEEKTKKQPAPNPEPEDPEPEDPEGGAEDGDE